MGSAIPDQVAPLVEAVDAVCAEFESKGAFRAFGPGTWVRDLETSWADEVEHVAFILEAEAPLLAVYVIIRRPDGDPEHVDALAKAIARANFGLLPGCFELDLDTGETRYRSVLQLSTEVGAPAVAQLLSDALVVAKSYARAFDKVVEEGADPAAAVDEIESE